MVLFAYYDYYSIAITGQIAAIRFTMTPFQGSSSWLGAAGATVGFSACVRGSITMSLFSYYGGSSSAYSFDTTGIHVLCNISLGCDGVVERLRAGFAGWEGAYPCSTR